MKVQVCDIRPNPFRNAERYPYLPGKIAQLRESLRATGFWDNLVGRRVAGAGGAVEIAYGHHRLQALQEEYGPEEEVGLIIRDLSDDDMLKIMARENMQEWGTSAAIEMETIRAVVEAYGDGRIELAAPPPDTSRNKLRIAPSFQFNDRLLMSGDRPYTAQALGEYVGWCSPEGIARQKVHDTLTALELIEEGILSDDDYRGLSTSQAQAVTQQARTRRDEARARARRAEQDAAGAEADAQRAAAAREEARAAREAERQREAAAQAQHDEEMRRAAAQRAQAAQEAYERSREEEVRLAERARASRQQAAQARSAGRQDAAAAGRHVGSQIRSGASVREATRSAQETQPVPAQYPLDMPARRTAQALTRLFTDSDVRNLLDQIKGNPASVSAGARGELLRSLSAVSGAASSWYEEMNPADDPDIEDGITRTDTLTIAAPLGVNIVAVS